MDRGKLLTEVETHDLDGKINQSSNLLTAIRTIIIADFVMSLDNALAITAAAKGDIGLVVFGLLLSVPIIIWGSALILRLMERFPVIITAGAGLLGWLGGGLMIAINYWPNSPLFYRRHPDNGNSDRRHIRDRYRQIFCQTKARITSRAPPMCCSGYHLHIISK